MEHNRTKRIEDVKNALLRFTTVVLVLVATAYAQTATPVVTDLWAIQARVEELKPKDAFETTAQYNARLASAFEVPHLIVTGSPRNTPFLRGSYYKEPKIDSPNEILSYTYLIPVDITQALLVDDRTSTVVATTGFSQAQAATPVHGTAAPPPANDAPPIDYRAKVGISFSEWLTLNSINLTELCRANYGACQRLTKIQKSGKGDFWTQDQYGKTVAWSFKGGKVVAVR
jgi:hypothetical protein